MKNIIMVLVVSLFVVIPNNNQALADDSKALYAITFHADWCGSCKVLEPKMVKARGKSDLDSENVLFVKLDLTDKTTRHQSSLLASALGVDEFYEQNAGETGFVLLVNSATGETVGKITKAMDANAIAETIQKNIKAL